MDDNESPVTIALQEALDKKYGMVFQANDDNIFCFVPVRKVFIDLFRIRLVENCKYMQRGVITTRVPKSVYDFLVMYDFDKNACEPFEFRYIL